MARENGPIATVQNKSGSVSKTQSIPANVSAPKPTGLSAPQAQRASHGHRIKSAGIGQPLDERHTRGREGRFGSSQAKTGFTPLKKMGSPTKKSSLDKAGVMASE